MFKKGFDLDEKIMRRNNIPLLHRDENWNKFFAEINEKSIVEPKEELFSLEEDQRKYEEELASLEREKKKMMKLILTASDSVNNENQVGNVQFIDEYKNNLLNIKDRMEELEFFLEMIPGKIRDANFRLLQATVDYGYEELVEKRKELDSANEELGKIRIRLKELIEIKYNAETWVNEGYLFLHGLLGSEIIDKIDRERLD